MSVSQQNPPPALKALLRHPSIRAVVWVDARGTVKSRHGQAHSLRLGANDPTVMMPIDTNSSTPDEAIYITKFAEKDFLVVIFKEEADFESLKEDVDATLRQL